MSDENKLDKLDVAIAEFEDETSEVPFEQRLSNLRSALMWNSFEAIKRIKRYGTKSPLSAEEEFKQENIMKQFHKMENMYNSELKMAKNTGKSKEEVDTDWLNIIKKKKSTIGEVVRDQIK